MAYDFTEKEMNEFGGGPAGRKKYMDYMSQTRPTYGSDSGMEQKAAPQMAAGAAGAHPAVVAGMAGMQALANIQKARRQRAAEFTESQRQHKRSIQGAMEKLMQIHQRNALG